MLAYYQSINLAISDSSSAFPNFKEGFEDEFKNVKAVCDNQKTVELEEWKTYYLKFYSKTINDSVSDLFQGDDFKNGGTFITDKIGDIYVINFQNYVGLSRIGPVNLEIINRKIDKNQYQSLLSYITDRYIDLVYQFSKTSNNDKSHTGFNTKRAEVGQNIDYVNFLFLQQKLLDTSETQSSIKEILNLILKEPHYKIQCDFVKTPAELVRSINPIRLIEAVTTGNNLALLESGHSLTNNALAIKLNNLSVNKNYYFPIQINEEKKYHSFDTAENRFVKYFLEYLLQLLGQLKKQFLGMKTYFNPELKREIDALYFPIKNCLEDQLWREVSDMQFIPTNSQILQRKEGYRQLLSLYSLMQLASRYDFNNFDFKNLVESKDTNILYEYWCFFTVKDILDELLGKSERCEQLVYENSDQTNQEVNDGTYLHYKNDIQLGFNITFASRHVSYSQEYRPDIVIKYNNNHLIFDAKHKLKGWGDDYSKPKKDDIDKMHTYRDAIKNSVGSFILYPGESNVLYQFHGSKYEYEGVGAIKLIPENTKDGRPEDKRKLVALIREFIGLSNGIGDGRIEI